MRDFLFQTRYRQYRTNQLSQLREAIASLRVSILTFDETNEFL